MKTDWNSIELAPLLNDKGEPNLMLLFEPHSMGGFCFVGFYHNEEWRDNIGSENIYHPTKYSLFESPSECPTKLTSKKGGRPGKRIFII